MVVEILVAEGDATDALGDEAAHAVPDPLGVAVIGEACALAVREREGDEEQPAVLAGSSLERLDKAGVTYAVNGSREERVAQNLNLSFEGIEAEALLAQLPTPAISSDSRVFDGLHCPIRRVDSDGSGGRPALEPGANRLREGNRAG